MGHLLVCVSKMGGAIRCQHARGKVRKWVGQVCTWEVREWVGQSGPTCTWEGKEVGGVMWSNLYVGRRGSGWGDTVPMVCMWEDEEVGGASDANQGC